MSWVIVFLEYSCTLVPWSKYSCVRTLTLGVLVEGEKMFKKWDSLGGWFLAHWSTPCLVTPLWFLASSFTSLSNHNSCHSYRELSLKSVLSFWTFSVQICDRDLNKALFFIKLSLLPYHRNENIAIAEYWWVISSSLKDFC